MSCLESIDSQQAIWGLVRLLETTTDGYIRRQAAESLGKVGAGNERAIRALVRSRRLFFSRRVHTLMMKYAQKMPYQKFYQAFHLSRRF